MTAQVVILNKFCAAVASDSSVTLSTVDGRNRTFPTGEKIVPLPKPHNIAILHSGSTELMGVPYSVLFGEWMRTLPGAALANVEDYGRSFLKWVEGQRSLFTPDVQTAYLAWLFRDYFLAVRGQLLASLKEMELQHEHEGSKGVANLIIAAISGRAERLESQPQLPGWEDVNTADLLRAYKETFDEARDWVFDDTPRTKEGDAKLVEVGELLLSHYEPFSTDATLAWVGFGEAELFPAAYNLTVQGLLDDRARTDLPNVSSVSLDMNSSILPLGQTEAVNTFLRAYHPAIAGRMHERLDSLMTQVKEAFAGGTLVLSKLDELKDKAHEDVEADFEDVSGKRFVQPMLDTVAGLPPREVARMAESLVGLQVLRQLTQAEAETVGGPIDVAIITRTEGLRWVRHKALEASAVV